MSAASAGSGSEPSVSVTRPSRPPHITFERWVEEIRKHVPEDVTDAQLRTMWGTIQRAGEELRLATMPAKNGPEYPCLPSLGEHCGQCHRCTPPAENGPYTGGHNDIQTADSGSSEATP